MRRFLFVLAIVSTLLACSGPAGRARCARCGMFTDLAPGWRAGATSAPGTAVEFDAPKCLFAWLASAEGRGARDPWVVEYYAQERAPAASLSYVVGTDLIGPMGADLIPVRGEEAAARLRAEHHGTRVVAFEAIDAALLHELEPR